MLRSMYSGISGLKNFQTKLDVIGNNISNVNTYGFKKGRVVFKDLISQTTAGASAPTETRGGVNAKQVGLGSQIAAIDTIHGTGSLQTTSRTLDLAISGDGFFQVADGIGGTETTPPTAFSNVQYTRAGNFYMDKDGYLVDSAGKYLVGLSGTVVTNSTNLTKFNATGPQPTDVDDDYFANVRYLAQANGNHIGADGTDLPLSGTANIGLRINGTKLHAGADGTPAFQVDTTPSSGPFDINIDPSTGAMTINVGSNKYSIQSDGTDMYYTDSSDTKVILTSATNGTENPTPKELFDAVAKAFIPNGSQVVETIDASNPTLKPIKIPTTAQSMSIGQDGTVNFVDASGELQWAGQLVLAKFANTGGLEKVGGNYYKESSNSGEPVVDFATQGGLGSIESGFLEMSNVDLSEEFTEMIVAQRGFQANSRIITTSDEILQELVNLKR